MVDKWMGANELGCLNKQKIGIKKNRRYSLPGIG